MKVKELMEGMKNINIEGKVVDIQDPREVKTKYGKTFLAKAKLEDDSGKINLTLWGDDALNVKEGMFIKIENGFVNSWNNEPQLTVGRFGKLSIKPSE